MVTRRLTFDDLYRLVLPSDPQLSPDGAKVAYVVTTVDRENDSYKTSIWLAAADGGTPIRLSSGPNDSSPRWSPDGTALAYLAPPAKDERPQIHLLPAAGGSARKLTDLKGGAGPAVWSPDGTKIAFGAGIDVIGGDANAPLVVDRLGYKADGTGLVKGRRQHLFVTDVASGTSVQLTWGNDSASMPAWLGGDELIYVARTGSEAERDLRTTSSVFALKTAGGKARRVIAGDVQAAAPRLTSDGRVLFAGSLTESPSHSRLYTVPVEGGEPTDIAPSFDRNVMVGGPGYPGALPQLAADGSVVFCARDRGCTHVFSTPIGGGQPTRVVGGWDRSVSGLSIASAAGRMAYIISTPTSPGEVCISAIDGSDERQLTNFATDALTDIELFAPVERTFTAPDGTEIHGWIVRDPDLEGATPLLLDAHGGPHNAWGPTFDGIHLYHQTLAADGWTVLYVNPRGSDGYGEAFYTAVAGAWGTSDIDDFLAPLDALVADGTADATRLAVTGYSYGGYTTCWLSARTDRFAAAVTGGCVSNLASMFGSSDAGYWLGLHETGGLPFADAELYRTHSPITYVDQVTAPTLILHGESDDRCPIGQGEEWFAALRARDVPVEMVRYPGASHLFIVSGKPSHRIDYSRRVDNWVKTHVAGADGVTRPGSLASQLRGYQDRFDQLAAQHKVPGASLAVLAGDEVVELATGVLSRDTKLATTPDALFQIGSITKVFTTTLVMQLVDKGLVDLDALVKTYLPDFALADTDAAATITVRHLLTHTSGIQGDYIVEFGRGDDAIEQYVASLRDIGLVHPVGALWSYCNSGFVVAGRIVEVLTGLPWHEALRENVLKPLGITSMRVLPEEIMLLPHAIGHVPDPADPAGDPKVAPAYGTHRSCAPAGSIPAAAARDLVTFVRMHLDEGRASDGTEVLSASSVKLMQERQVDVPLGDGPLERAWGLGWALSTCDDQRVIGHGGGTLGQTSLLQVLPDRRVAVSILSNGPGGGLLNQSVVRDLFGAVGDVDVPAEPVSSGEPPTLDLTLYEGTYENIAMRVDVAVKDGALQATLTMLQDLDPTADEPEPQTLPLTPVDAKTFAVPGLGQVGFIEPDADGKPRYFFAGRAARRVS